MKMKQYFCTVTDYLDDSAERYPNKIIFENESESVTYKHFRENAQKIASSIIKDRFFKKPVLVFMDKNINCLTTFMGVAYSGNFYTPIDPDMPILRVNKITETLLPSLIVTERKYLSVVSKIQCQAKIYCYEDFLDKPINTSEINAVQSRMIDTDALYVFFTSGSTGTPKGVVICHRSVIDYTEWVTSTFSIDENTVFGNQAPFYFDNSILDIFSTLKTGAKMNIIPPKKFTFPAELLDYIGENKINSIFWVPSVLCFVANLKALDREWLPNLDRILFCGEVMPNKQLNAWRRRYPNALFANLYGPTEITDVCAYYIVDREFSNNEPLPIGKPCRNTDILVLSDDNLPVKEGEIGELCVRGTSLSFGYYNNQEKTESVFVQNPLNPYYPETIYRTGDLVKYNERGELIYLSRKDFQIKHLGHRIELGEIETAVYAVEGVEYAACIYDDVRKRIVLFYKGEIEKEDCVSSFKSSIPIYMIPGKVVRLQEFPLNMNGKADRVKLKEML